MARGWRCWWCRAGGRVSGAGCLVCRAWPGGSDARGAGTKSHAEPSLPSLVPAGGLRAVALGVHQPAGVLPDQGPGGCWAGGPGWVCLARAGWRAWSAGRLRLVLHRRARATGAKKHTPADPALPLRLPPSPAPPQEVSLNYHMKCEQSAHSAARSFFNFNGTAGGLGRQEGWAVGWASLPLARHAQPQGRSMPAQPGMLPEAAAAPPPPPTPPPATPPQACGAWPASSTRAGGTGVAARAALCPC